MSEKIDGMSMDIEATNLEKVKSLFPECVSEGKLDIDKLLSLCGEYIDNDFEKYKFEWNGKAECLRLAQKRSTGTLRPCESESAGKDGTPGKFDSDNLYIEGDNLEVLKLLQTAYYRKVKMIYIDPPYNTGNDFVYEDDFADPINRYKEVTSQTTKSNPETMGRYHTNWLNMMYPRLRLAANLLREDGVIFISIDDNEVDNLKKLCNEVFGEENFVAQCIRRTINSGKHDTATVAVYHEYILVYAKDIAKILLNKKPKSNDERDRLYPEKDKYENERGRFYVSQLNKNSIQYSDSLNFPIIGPDGVDIYPGGGFNDKEWCWRWGKEKVKWGIENDYIVFKKQGDHYKVYAKSYEFRDNSGEPIERTNPYSTLEFVAKEYGNFNATPELSAVFDGKKYFDFPKSIVFIMELLRLANLKNDDIILDFFSGSATTAHAVMQLNAEDGGNRKFIMVQLPEVCDEKSEAYKAGYKNICEIGKERIRRAGAKIKADNPDAQELDTGFKVYKLDTSNLVTWDSAPIENHDIMTLLNKIGRAHV